MTKQKHKIFYSPEAVNDLDEIFDYIRDDLQNPSAAHRVVMDIIEAIEKLRDFPEMGSVLYSITGVEQDYRHLLCGRYLAFYRFTHEGIFIDRVLYSRRDYLHILFGDLPEN
jgi:toxin ParE1/3/4